MCRHPQVGKGTACVFVFETWPIRNDWQQITNVLVVLFPAWDLPACCAVVLFVDKAVKVKRIAERGGGGGRERERERARERERERERARERERERERWDIPLLSVYVEGGKCLCCAFLRSASPWWYVRRKRNWIEDALIHMFGKAWCLRLNG